MNKKAAVAVSIVMAAALVLAGAAFSRSSATKTLKGVVGPGYSISLKMNGKKVKTLKAGKYKIVVSDQASIHNFTLEREHPTSPHMEKHITSTAFMGTTTITWTLKPGSWRAYCSIHEAMMHQDFKVTK